MYRIFLPIASASANNKVPHSVKYIYKKVLLLSSFFLLSLPHVVVSGVGIYFFCSRRRRRCSRSRFWSLLFRKDTFLFLLSSPCWLYLFRVLAEVFHSGSRLLHTVHCVVVHGCRIYGAYCLRLILRFFFVVRQSGAGCSYRSLDGIFWVVILFLM